MSVYRVGGFGIGHLPLPAISSTSASVIPMAIVRYNSSESAGGKHLYLNCIPARSFNAIDLGAFICRNVAEPFVGRFAHALNDRDNPV
jgi:hypothetical protein